MATVPIKPTQALPLAPSKARVIPSERKPDWIRIRPPSGETQAKIKAILREGSLHTVCEEAHCPNLSECWAGGTATFMLAGDTCTRACRFCAVKTARLPPPLDPDEPQKLADTVSKLGLRYVVLTSVNRDELPDGGAGHFSKTIRAIRAKDPSIIIEALVPDFQGNENSVQTVVDSKLEVFAHNIETVERLQKRVRDPRASYGQSLGVLKIAQKKAEKIGHALYTKSSMMLGIGETIDELAAAFQDLKDAGVGLLTLGQYLRPSLEHLPVEKFYTLEEFQAIRKIAEKIGFLYVAAGPLVRSSYRAAEHFIENNLIRRDIRGI